LFLVPAAPSELAPWEKKLTPGPPLAARNSKRNKKASDAKADLAVRRIEVLVRNGLAAVDAEYMLTPGIKENLKTLLFITTLLTTAGIIEAKEMEDPKDTDELELDTLACGKLLSRLYAASGCYYPTLGSPSLQMNVEGQGRHVSFTLLVVKSTIPDGIVKPRGPVLMRKDKNRHSHAAGSRSGVDGAGGSDDIDE
jgi:hypothetical protein